MALLVGKYENEQEAVYALAIRLSSFLSLCCKKVFIFVGIIGRFFYTIHDTEEGQIVCVKMYIKNLISYL